MRAAYFPRERLPLKPDVPGARRWAVSLDRVMLTYFEIEPGARFERHAHESEQITLVLEGELVFQFDDGETRVGPGEVIAVPAGAPHAVRTENSGAKAVDAWSPPATKYLDKPEQNVPQGEDT
jgi:quercetin dioxygenase-like cupin family protein